MFEMIQSVDASVLLWIQEHLRFAFLNGPMIFAGLLGDNGLCWIVLGLVLTLIPKTRKYGVLALASLLGCFLFNNLLLKNLVARPRPYTRIPELVMLMKVPPDHSFPSGHACASFATAGALMWSMGKEWNRVRIPALAVAVWIAFSRLYVGVHYPTDVLAGVLVGLVGSWIICHICEKPYDRLCQRFCRHRSDSPKEM
ncbi:MAG: phosphatase PAP2 family protein [Eubacteriales bacterium]|nr:phosphatase PAP2 family protein [Eubacteriales bacterium]